MRKDILRNRVESLAVHRVCARKHINVLRAVGAKPVVRSDSVTESINYELN